MSGETENVPLVVVDKPRYTCKDHPEWSGDAPVQWGNHVRELHQGINPLTGKPLKNTSTSPANLRLSEPPVENHQNFVKQFERKNLDDAYLTVIDHLKEEQERIERTIWELEEQLAKVRKTTGS